MKKSIYILLVLTFPLVSRSQALLEVALKDKSNIIINKPFKIDLENYTFNARDFYGYLDLIDSSFPITDTTKLKEFIALAKAAKPDLNPWIKEEMPNKIIIALEEYIKPKIGLETIGWKTKEEKKAILKEIRKYNGRGTEWRSFPLTMSRPVFNSDTTLALIGLIRGNNGGNVSLYRKENEAWLWVCELKRWAY